MLGLGRLAEQAGIMVCMAAAGKSELLSLCDVCHNCSTDSAGPQWLGSSMVSA